MNGREMYHEQANLDWDTIHLQALKDAKPTIEDEAKARARFAGSKQTDDDWKLFVGEIIWDHFTEDGKLFHNTRREHEQAAKLMHDLEFVECSSCHNDDRRYRVVEIGEENYCKECVKDSFVDNILHKSIIRFQEHHFDL